MKIVHLAPSAPYNDYWGYQDNLLPKYHKKLGHTVTLITTNTMHSDGQIVETDCADYMLRDGVRVIRRKIKKYPHRALTGLASYIPVYDLLCQLQPDLIFHHGLVSTTMLDVVRYKKKNPSCVIIQDNHLDYNIGSQCKTLKERLFRAYYRHINRRTIGYVSKVYGVTPWRKTYAEDYFKIPPQKTDVLIMGADDEKIDFANRESIRAAIRQKYAVTQTDFLIVTGGKIDRKKKIHLLMEACKNMPGIKLLIFGQVSQDLQEAFDQCLQSSENLIYIGWIQSDQVYDYFFAADLVFFPGQHSVLWEQACAAKVPCVFEAWEGMEHVDNGGNSAFLSPVTTQTLRELVSELCYSPKYYQMKQVAESEMTDIYLYSNIAKKSLESV